MREIEELVAEIHRNTERVRETTRRLAAMNVRQPIEAGLGVVVVNGYGSLRDIRLDPKALRYADAARTSKRILGAVLAAEERARQLRAEHPAARPVATDVNEKKVTDA